MITRKDFEAVIRMMDMKHIFRAVEETSNQRQNVWLYDHDEKERHACIICEMRWRIKSARSNQDDCKAR